MHLNEAGNRFYLRGLMDVLQTQFSHCAPMSDEDGDGQYEAGFPFVCWHSKKLSMAAWLFVWILKDLSIVVWHVGCRA
jgi:hypothetical protein